MVMIYYFFFPTETEEHISIITLLLTMNFNSFLCIRRLFLTRTVDPFYIQRHTKKTLLMLAAQYGRTDFMKVLIEEYGADITERDREGRDVVCFAIIHRHLETLRFLLEDCRASPDHAFIQSNTHSQPGYRPLHLLCSQYGYPTEMDDEILNLLLGAHANIHSRTKEGKTPFMLECQEFRRLYILYRLLKTSSCLYSSSNPLVGHQDYQGKTALHHLCTPRMLHTHQWKDKIQLLLNQHADPNIQDYKGWTPLMYFCEWDGDCTFLVLEEEEKSTYLDVIEMFLQYDTDPLIKNRKSETVIDRLMLQLKHISIYHSSWDRKTKALQLIHTYIQQRTTLTKLYYLFHEHLINEHHPLFSFEYLLPEHQYEVIQYLCLNTSESLRKHIFQYN
uniref:Uncharacterized protein n=1 Tax=viral metagenome TaxID=1070528 RepID=A0A6C0CYZ6_9ZZZZ